MFDKSDIVAIAEVISTEDTGEATTLPEYNSSLVVVGVVTEFRSLVVLKGSRDVVKFKLHHYRYQVPEQEAAVADTPDLIRIQPGKHSTFLLFLAKRRESGYVPVTGQTDPGMLSVLELKGGAD